MNRSSTVGIPKERVPFPEGLGISTLLTGWGTWVPDKSLDARPVFREMGPQVIDGHAVYTRRTLVGPDLAVACYQVLAAQYLH